MTAHQLRPPTRRRALAIGVTAALALTGLAAAGVAAGGSRDDAGLQAVARPPGARIEARADGPLGRMTLAEKLQQIQLLSDGQVTDADARAGVGGVFSLVDPARINALQHIAV